MYSGLLLLLLQALSFTLGVHGLAATDSTSDADPPQSGYLPNHNMNPDVVNSPIFGILWTNPYGKKEKWYAKPLVYTTANANSGKQLVFLASSMNIIRTIDAVTGALISQRQLQPPFLQSELGCTDIPDYIGIIGTPVIDPSTDTAYFFSKGYKNGASSGGVANGIYKFYAVSISDLSDRPGFPVLVDGHNADNDASRYFIGGTVLQRPSVALIGGVVFGGFGGHCDLFNYTGMVVGVSTTPNVGVVSLFATEISPFAPDVVTDINSQHGGKAGIWQGGMGLATDGSRLFFATGNGMGHENKETPASGRSLLSTLDECVVNLGVSGNGKLALADYFEPYEYLGMDAGDRDLGSGGVALLDPSVFSGAGVSRIAVTIGKNGKAYIMNADNLGGFKLGAGATDNVIQTITAAGAVFGGAGSYPLEGGFIYFTPVGAPTVAYKVGLDASGKPLFTKAGQSADSSAGRVGVGVPTITTYKGQVGTGILWVTDVDTGLRAYKAVPDSNGNLIKINIPPTGGLNKFQRPAFGDTRLYVSDNNGNVICLGSPVSLPLNCTSPVEFGSVQLGSTSTKTITCTALIAITSLAGLTTSDKTWVASNSSLPTGPLAQGQTFKVPVTWNLTQSSVQDAQNASYGATSPGVKSGALTIYTNNGVAKYSNSLPVSLTGTQVSAKPFLQLSPAEVDFGGIVIGGNSTPDASDNSFVISNLGNLTMTITGYGYADDLDPPVDYTNTTASVNGTRIGDNFVSSDLPAKGTQVAPGQSIIVPVSFEADDIGNYQNIFTVWTDGGVGYVLMTGSATTSPIANFGISTGEGDGYDPNPVMDFGVVTAGTTVTRKIRICNQGGSPLEITKSKPPKQTELRAENPDSDLHEGQYIAVGECAYGPVDIAALPEPRNYPDHSVSDAWILNTDDLNFGVHEVAISAVIRSQMVGPTLSNGTTRFAYLGCYYDGNGRQLLKQYTPPNNENGICQKTCQDAGYIFAGTEYHTQCWCGNTPPAAAKYYPESAKKCTWSCPGDITQSCGGDGTFVSIYYDITKYTPGCGSIPCSSSSSSSSSSIISSSSSSSSSSFIISSTISTTVNTSSSTSSVSSSPSGVPNASNTPATLLSTNTTTPLATSTTAPLATSTTTTSVAVATPTGPIVNPGDANWKSLGCYLDPATPGKALYPYTKYANDSMTVAICQAFCKGLGNMYAGVEYRRECYCSNTLVAGATANVTGCTLTCMGNSFEYCGGSSRMNVYQAILSTLASSTSSVSRSTSSATLLLSTSSATASSNSSAAASSTNLIASTTAATSSLGSAVSSTTVSNSTSAIGTAGSASATGLSSTSSTNPSSTYSSTSSTSLGISTSLNTTSVTSTTTLTTTNTTTPTTITSTSANSISTTTTAPTTTPMTSSTTNTTAKVCSTTTTTATMGYYSQGCFAEPAGTRALPRLLLANDSMSAELCLSMAKAALPATTYRYVGLEYGRECWAATSAFAAPTQLVGSKACPKPCIGNTTQSCGGTGMFNLYVSNTVTFATTVSVATSTTGSVVSTTTATAC